MNWSNKLECFLQVIHSSFVTVEQPSLLGQFISYKENEVVRIWLQNSVSNQLFLLRKNDRTKLTWHHRHDKINTFLMLWGHIFSHVQPFYEQGVSNLDRSMHISLWVKVTHSSFIEGSHMTKYSAFGYFNK